MIDHVVGEAELVLLVKDVDLVETLLRCLRGVDLVDSRVWGPQRLLARQDIHDHILSFSFHLHDVYLTLLHEVPDHLCLHRVHLVLYGRIKVQIVELGLWEDEVFYELLGIGDLRLLPSNRLVPTT